MSAKESSEQASLTAPLKSPSSSFRETLVAKYSMGSCEGVFPTGGGGGRCCSRCDSWDIRFLTQLLVDSRGQQPPFTASPWSAQTPGAESKEAVPHGVVVRLDTCVKNGSQLLPALLS